MVLTQWFNLGFSVSVVKKLPLISPFVTKVPFVALKLIVYKSLCMITWFKLVFSESPLCRFCFIYMCALFCHFSGSFFTLKKYYSRKQGFKYVKHDFRVLAPTSSYTSQLWIELIPTGKIRWNIKYKAFLLYVFDKK